MDIFNENNLTYERIHTTQLRMCGFVPEYHESHVKIPNRVNGLPVTKVGLFAFMGDRVLEAVDISENVEIVETKAMENCSNLKYVFFNGNKSLIKVENRAFAYCEQLTGLTILRPTYVAIEAFRWCKNLRNIDINALSIEDYAFAECSLLHTVLLRGESISIEAKAFAQSPRIDKFYIDGEIMGSFDFARFLPTTTEIHCHKGSNVEELVYYGFKVLTDI